jgi:polyphosphate kinase
LPGISKNIRVVSIVGRFLEHSRIYYFRNGGKEQYLIGSADAMKRNLEARVEVVVPVEDRKLRAEIRTLFDVLLDDKRSAWDMQPDGSYVQRMPAPGQESRGSHEVLIELAAKRQKKMARLKKRKTQGVGGRNLR